MNINTFEGVCSCGKAIVGIEVAGKEHWFHVDGNVYRHMIIPQDEKFHQRADFETMKKDRDDWIGALLDEKIKTRKLEAEIEELKNGLRFYSNESSRLRFPDNSGG